MPLLIGAQCAKCNTRIIVSTTKGHYESKQLLYETLKAAGWKIDEGREEFMCPECQKKE